MRKLFLAFLLLGTSLSGLAQQTKKYEYWFDQNDKEKVAQQSCDDNIDISIDVSGLKAGLHSLALRVQDSEGKWSSPFTTYFLRSATSQTKESTSYYEYWVDSDTDSKVSSTSNSNVFALDLDVSSLSKGIHTLCFRTRDYHGYWSAPLSNFFLVAARTSGSDSSSRYEYWLDNDHKNKVSAKCGNGIVNLDVDASSLSLGMHTLSFRYVDVLGVWSAPQTCFFMVTNHQSYSTLASTYEYWIDSNYTEKQSGKGTDKLINLNVDVSMLSSGLHSFTFRTSDQYGRWSTPQTSYFIVGNNKRGQQDIRFYRYWFNNASEHSILEKIDPAVIPFTLDAKLSIADIVTDITPETITMTEDGEGHMKLATKNVLHTQYCTTDGRWTAVTADTFAVVVNAKEVDLTSFIKNPVATDNWNEWKTEGSTTGIQNSLAWEEGFNYFRLGNTSRSEWTSSMEQTITGLPAGTYILSAKGRAAQDVEMEISANGFADVFPATGTEGGELGNGWNERSIIFTTDGLPFVIKVSGSAKASGKWMDVSDFQLTYSNASNASLTVSMPEKTDMQQYKNLKLQLTSVSSKLSVTTSDSKEYTFQGLAAGVAYDLTLTNRYGQIVAKKESIFINEGENNAILPELATLCNAEAAVLGSDNTNLTNKSRITWMLADNSVISEDSNVTGLLGDTKLMCNVSLGDSLGCVYHEVTGQECQLKAGSNTVNISLVPIEKATVTGKVLTNDGNASLRATVSITALLSGKYAKTHAVRTDTKGAFTTDCHQDSLHIVVSSDGYLDCVIDTVCRTSELDLGTLRMKEITGIVVTPRLNYTRAVEDDAEDALLYTDTENVDYTVKNLATNSILDDVAVQSGNIIVKSGAAVGERLAITVHSRKDEFADVTVEAVIADDETANAEFELTEKGGIKATYEFSGNTDNVAMLYDENGSLVSRQFYNGSKCSFSHLADGHYSLLTMGKTLMLDAILNLADVSAIGLTEGVDYVLSTADVKAGKITVVNNDVIPAIDETLFYYTGTNTSFTANKNSVVVGNYITLTGRLDFKEEYAADVDNLSLVVDLPEGMEYVKGSAIIGTTLAPCSVDGNRLTISLNRNNYQERIRFCVVPTKGGSMMPSAFVAFSLDKEIMQPIGSASITAKDMTISVPATVAKTDISVSGVAVPYSKVTVYDGSTTIGQITAKADGNWLVKGQLVEPYNLSTHNIYAHVLTPQEIDMNTESVNVLYDKNAIEVKTVTMLNTAHTAANLNLYEYRTVFDFQNPEKEPSIYWYWPKYPEFTFIVDFTKNDTTAIYGVKLCVYTSSGDVVTLEPVFDEKKQAYVVSHEFNSNSLPTSVSVDYGVNVSSYGDRRIFDNNMEELCNQMISQMNAFYDIKANIMECFNDEDETFTEEDFEGDDDFKQLYDEYAQWRNYNSTRALDDLWNAVGFPVFEDITIPDSFTSVTTTTSRGAITYDSEKLSSINHEELVNDGYVCVEINDGTKIYYKYDDTVISYIDTRNSTKYTISSTETSAGAREINAKSSGIGLSDFAKCLDTAQSSCDDLSDLINTLKEIKEKDIKDQAVAYANILYKAASLCTDVIDGIECFYSIGRDIVARKMEQALDEFLTKIDNLRTERISKMHDLETNISYNKLKLQHLRDDMTAQEIIKLEKEIARDQKKYDALANEIADLSKQRIYYRNLGDTKIKAQLEKLPKFLQKGTKLAKGIEVTGKCLGVIGVLIEAYSWGCDMWDFYQETKEWGELIGTCAKKLPCPCDQSRAESICLRATESGVSAVSNMVRIIKAEAAAIVIDAAMVADPEFSLVNWFASGICNGFAEINKATRFVSDINKRGIFYVELMNLHCFTTEEGKPCTNEPDPDPKPNKWPKIKLPNPPSWSPHPHWPRFPWWEPKSKATKPTGGVQDPSGYVYEAVSSNRLEGVTATICQKVTTEDMYGDKHDNIVKWDAEPYSQKNPVKTDINGLYAWDVPNGLWQVKFEKEGYETVYSEWLPVPPPQLDINVPMYQSVQPEVMEARGFESGVDFTFSKYMRPETFEDGCVTLSRDGKQLTGHLTMLNVEKEPLDGIEYASHVKFIPEQALHVGDVVTLTVSGKVKSYCGVAMAKDYTTTLVIQPEIKEIVVNPVVNIVYGSKAEIAVSVLPADAAKGKKLMVQNGTPSIINIEGNELMLDANGSAIIPVSGTLPGNGALRLSVENSDATAEIAVTVVVPSNEISVPEASIPSGATVEKGSVVVLSCLTDGATIYYTLDGSCPCDEATRLVYTEPIVINETVTIKAMAVAQDMTESDIVEFTYIVEEGDGIDDVTIDENLKIYPLPVRDKLNITAGGKIIRSVTLVSMSGSTVVAASKPVTHVTIDVSNLTSGIYIINVATEDKTYSRKIMKVE